MSLRNAGKNTFATSSFVSFPPLPWPRTIES